MDKKDAALQTRPKEEGAREKGKAVVEELRVMKRNKAAKICAEAIDTASENVVDRNPNLARLSHTGPD